MTHICCPACRLRFTPMVGVSLVACPGCGGEPEPIASVEHVLGFQLFEAGDVLPPLPQARAAAMPPPEDWL
jgi:hypothetical protein